ncbi:hypothetical protein GLOIN_2v1769275 [Rhizophagus irregularis DAOM 181602=DAOM 197198]|nr:hypothetical protein GLOIN_2v1769275 [Rhizophagus irregularis DAOM 181602=DAOM 197198]
MCCLANQSHADKTLGVLPFVAPEVLKRKNIYVDHSFFKYSVSSPCGAFLALNRTSFRAINEVLATSANSILRQQDQGHKDVESQR